MKNNIHILKVYMNDLLHIFFNLQFFFYFDQLMTYTAASNVVFSDENLQLFLQKFYEQMLQKL